MFRHKTVVVLGAGASKECHLPIGEELKPRIAELLDFSFKYGMEQERGDYEIVEALRIHVRSAAPPSRDINPYLHAGWRIRDGLPQSISIDNLLDLHQGDAHIEMCGKLAVVRSILEGERNSLLYFEPHGSRRHPEYAALDKSWYNAFMKLMTQGCPLKDLAARLANIAFVIFNYDRCVEHFLYHSIQNVYGVTETVAGELLGNATFLHPYGTVGRLPWQGGQHIVAYGAETQPHELLSLASGIKTFTEGTDPKASDILHIKAQILEAAVLLFMGFAYHSQNLDLLQPDHPHPDPDAVRYYGTAYGMSDSDRDLVASDLVRLGSARPESIIIRSDLTCAGMFQEYWRSLSLG